MKPISFTMVSDLDTFGQLQPMGLKKIANLFCAAGVVSNHINGGILEALCSEPFYVYIGLCTF